MTLYRPVGNQLLSQDQINTLERTAPAELNAIRLAADSGQESLGGEPTPFEPIGINKPLSIEIRHIYTGEHPRGAIFRSDMLVTSAIRSIASFDAQPRAVNFLKGNVDKQFNLRNPAASDDGTPLVYYSHALVDENSVMDIEIVFQRFPEELFETLSGAFKVAAGVPVFVMKGISGLLLAASTVTRIAGALGERLVDGRPVFKQTVELSFTRAGSPVPVEGFHILTNPEFDPQRARLEFDSENGRLLNADGTAYNGPHPYVVISLDGRQHEAYRDFAATAASAALLDSFFHIGEGQQSSLSLVQDAIKLYNDYQFKQKADALATQMERLAPDSAEYQRLEARRDAYLSNLLTDSFALRGA